MRITITCEECGRRHRLERTIDEAGPIWIVCHDCELPLRAVLETTSAATPVTAPEATVAASQSFVDAWTGTLDVSSSSTSA